MAGFDDNQELRGPDFIPANTSDNPRSVVQGQESEPKTDSPSSSEKERLIPYEPGNGRDNKRSVQNKGLSANAKKGIAGVVATAIIGIGTFFGIGSSGGLTIVNIDAVARQKFGMVVESVIENRQSKIWVKKINASSKTATIKGMCGRNIQIACRFDGMSDKEIKKFQERAKARGFNVEVEASDTKNILGRRAVSAITVDDNKMSAAVFAGELGKANSPARTAMKSVMKPWIAAWAGANINNLFSKLGISKARNVSAATSVEDAKEKIKQNQLGNTELDASTRAPLPDDENEAKKVAEQNQYADKLTNSELKSSSLGDRIRTNALKNLSSTAQETVTRMAGSVAKGVLITGAVDSACTVVNTVSAIGYMAKYAGALQLIRFAMTFSNVAHATKADEATPASHQALNSILGTTTATDKRTAPDSYGYQYMAYDILGDSTDTAEFKLGGGIPSEMNGFMEQVNGLTQGGAVCNFIQNPGVRIGSALIGVAAAILSGGTVTAGQIAASASIAAGLTIIQQFSMPLIADMIAGEFVNDSTVGNSGGNAITSGYGAFYGQLSNNTGLQPLTTEQAVLFDATTKAEYVADAKQESIEETGQFDIANPSSFLGSLAMQLSPALNSQSVADFSGKLVSLVANPVSKTAQAATDPKAQYEVCTDADYERLGIATDPFCNPVYGMSDSALAKDVDDVIVYMHDNKHIDDQGNPLGDYGTFIAECVDNTSPFGINNEDVAGKIKPDSCIPGKTDRPEEFWVYTVDSRIYEKMQCLIEEDSTACGAASVVGNNTSGSCPAGAVGVSEIKKGYWDGGYRDATFCAIDNTVDSSLSGIRDADVFRDNNQVLQTNTTGKIVVIDRAASDMVNLVKKYIEDTDKSAFAATFSYRSHNQQCVMFYYTNFNAASSTYSKLPTSCSGLSQDIADTMRRDMSGNYYMPKPFYVSDHESGRALDVVDLSWINKCASGNYDGDGYTSNTCYNFASAAIDGDLHHVVWKGN